MRRTPVSSSSITSVGYDPTSHTLEIEFVSGATYRYRQVEQSVYEALMRAESKGRYVNAHVRTEYPYSRLYRL